MSQELAYACQVMADRSSQHSSQHVHAAGGSGSAIPEADKAAVRDNLLEGIVRAPPLVRAQLGECLKSIVYSDFPERWPGILQAVQQQLATQVRPFLSTAAIVCFFRLSYAAEVLQVSFHVPLPLWSAGRASCRPCSSSWPRRRAPFSGAWHHKPTPKPDSIKLSRLRSSSWPRRRARSLAQWRPCDFMLSHVAEGAKVCSQFFCAYLFVALAGPPAGHADAAGYAGRGPFARIPNAFNAQVLVY